MQNIKISLQRNLVHGTLFWINASNKKVYHSSKRFDAEEFIEHESNYLGEFEQVLPKKNQPAILRVLKKVDRAFGICLYNQDGLTNLNKGRKQGTINVMFFDTLDELLAFSEPYFAEYDANKKLEEEEEKRKIEARNEWLTRGKEFLKDSKEQ